MGADKNLPFGSYEKCLIDIDVTISDSLMSFNAIDVNLKTKLI